LSDGLHSGTIGPRRFGAIVVVVVTVFVVVVAVVVHRDSARLVVPTLVSDVDRYF
jgi:hypothetical protein